MATDERTDQRSTQVIGHGFGQIGVALNSYRSFHFVNYVVLHNWSTDLTGTDPFRVESHRKHHGPLYNLQKVRSKSTITHSDVTSHLWHKPMSSLRNRTSPCWGGVVYLENHAETRFFAVFIHVARVHILRKSWLFFCNFCWN